MTKTKAIAGLGLLSLCVVLALSSLPPSDQAPRSIRQHMAQQEHSQASTLSQRLIAQDDLPPSGSRSLFDHHIEHLGELPYPFEKLLDSFTALDRWKQGSVRLLIPDGRSLAKGHTDFKQPRVLAAAQLDSLDSDDIAPLYSGRLFLGFAESINTIEVISYNEAAGRFEFQLVQNYCQGCQPKLIYAKRAVCLSCHQDGSPIFSARPWSETNAHYPISQAIAKARKVPWQQASQQTYHGAPISTQILMPETFDELADLGAQLNLAQRIWIDGCGETGLSCRRELLIQSLSLLLSPGDFDPASSTSQNLRRLQEAHWPEQGIAVNDNSLANRIPPPASHWLERRLKKLRAWWHQSFQPTTSTDSTTNLQAFERLPRLAAELDPLRLRPPVDRLDSQSLAGVQAVAKMFSVHDRKILRPLGPQSEELIREIILSGELDTLLTAQAFNRVAILQQLLKAVGQTEPDYCCLKTATVESQAKPSELAIPVESELKLFQRYCFACHRGNPIKHLDFMAGNSTAQVLQSIRQQPRIKAMLSPSPDGQAARMPPENSAQRALLNAAMAKGNDDLRTMRESLQLPKL